MTTCVNCVGTLAHAQDELDSEFCQTPIEDCSHLISLNFSDLSSRFYQFSNSSVSAGIIPVMRAPQLLLLAAKDTQILFAYRKGRPRLRSSQVEIQQAHRQRLIHLQL